jgi:hypothetical protein
MDTRCAGRIGGITRKQRLSAERLREIAKVAADASVSKRNARRETSRCVARWLQDQDADLAQLKTNDLEQVVFHATELGRILASLREGEAWG